MLVNYFGGRGKVVNVEPRLQDVELIESSWAEPALFGYIYDRHAQALFAYLARRVGRAEAEPLLGELFRVAFEARHGYRVDRLDARPWLYGIAGNLVLKHYRTEARRRRAIERFGALRPVESSFEGEVDSAVVSAESWPMVASAIADLPDPTERWCSSTPGRTSAMPRSPTQSTFRSAPCVPGSTGYADNSVN